MTLDRLPSPVKDDGPSETEPDATNDNDHSSSPDELLYPDDSDDRPSGEDADALETDQAPVSSSICSGGLPGVCVFESKFTLI
jgi:hypothetical protein